jgi:hypothetical protein
VTLSAAEVAVPRVKKLLRASSDNAARSHEATPRDVACVGDVDGVEPELRRSSVVLDVDVWWFEALVAVEKEPESIFPVDCGHRGPPNASDPRTTFDIWPVRIGTPSHTSRLAPATLEAEAATRSAEKPGYPKHIASRAFLGAA